MRLKLAMRTAAWFLAAIVVINGVVFLSPWKVLIRAVDRKFVADHDIQYDVPLYAGERWGGRKVHRGKVCIYWGGAATTWPVFIAPGSGCPIIK